MDEQQGVDELKAINPRNIPMSTIESLQAAITQLQGRYDDMESRLSYYFQQFSEQRGRMDSLSNAVSVLDDRTSKIRYELNLLNEDTETDYVQLAKAIEDIKVGTLGDDE